MRIVTRVFSSPRLLDHAVKERLHLKGENPVSLKLIRGAIQSCDAISRAVTGQPLLALKESEALLDQLSDLKGGALISALMAQQGGTKIVPHGLQHIPDTGPVIIASTHPTGIFDFAAHADALWQKRPDLKVVANREVEKILGPDAIVPVTIDKQNRATSGAATGQAMLDHLDHGGPNCGGPNGGALLIFGSGRVPDRRDGRLKEPAWRRGTTKISHISQAIVIPAALNARNSDTYYRLRAAARLLSGGNDHFGAMVGSLRYGAELLVKLGGRFDVYYGPPLAPGTGPDTLKSAAESLVPGLYHGVKTQG